MHAPRRFAMVRGVRLDRWVGSVIDCVDTMRELWGCVAGDLPRAQRGGKLTDGPVHDFGNVGLQRAGEGNDRTEGGGGCEEGTGSRQALRPSPARLPAGPAPGVESRLDRKSPRP